MSNSAPAPAPYPALHRSASARIAIAFAVVVALASPSAPLAFDKVFSSGSLIIPAQIEYQTDNGAISAYGLVYTILYKNAARVRQSKKPITIYWVIQPSKQSHHRCYTQDDTLPSYTSFNDDDGCDLAVQSAAGQPVALLQANNSELAPFTASALAYDSNNGNVSRSGTFNVDSSKMAMKYSGGVWVIDAIDRNDVLYMLANDPDFAQYHASGDCGTANNCHYVNIHSARVSFTAPVARAINEKPPVLALIGTGQVNLLEDYLNLAGLTNIPSYSGTISSHGVIYDVVNPLTDFVSTPSYANGAINMPADPNDATKGNYYKVLWAPHWSIDAQSTIPSDCDPGDDSCGDGIWTHNGDDAKTNAYKNINRFADTGNGIFAECVSIVSLEGLNASAWSPCTTTEVCQDSAGDQVPFDCGTTGYTPVQACNNCYQCTNAAMQTLDTTNCAEPVCYGGCAPGQTPACSACWTCPSGWTLNSSNCNAVTCQTSACPTGLSYVCNGCWSCPTNGTPAYNLNSISCSSGVVCTQCPSGYTFSSSPPAASQPCWTYNSASCTGANTYYSPSNNKCETCSTGSKTFWVESCGKCYNTATPNTCNNGGDPSSSSSPNKQWTTGTNTPPQGTPAACTWNTAGGCGSCPNANCPQRFGFQNVPAATSAPQCDPNYQLICPNQMSGVTGGSSFTRFHATDGLVDNGLGNSFAPAGAPDCTDRQLPSGSFFLNTSTGDCLDYHPDQGGPGQIFSQKGNFNYSGTTGEVHEYMPDPQVSTYWSGVSRIITSRNASDPTRDGWDFGTFRHKDGDPEKGVILYLAGHSYKNDPWGLRVVLNSLLNLGFSPAGIDMARSEPVGYNNATTSTQRVYQGSFVDLPPPGPFQDWVNYTTTAPESWRFPYTVGHLREYDLSSISTTAQTFATETADWDAATKMPLPGSRTIFTMLGGSADRGWHQVNWSYTETRSGCTDTNSNSKCDLSEALAACPTAGVTTANLSNSSVTGTQQDTLGMFVQQVRGYCSAHDHTTGAAIMAPSDSQCDAIHEESNRAKLGGIDHGSPAIVGPSRYVTSTPWSTRPVVAYVGGRDGMLHAIYVSGSTTWSADGKSLPSGVQAGQELWAFVPPGQICGLATNNAMVDASVNVIDVFGNFPHDVNNDGVIDWSASSTEKPTGVREWRTVLLAAAGQGGSELFALDITNPLKPVLLWHVGGPTDHDGKWDANANGRYGDSGDVFSQSDPTTYAIKWFDWDDGASSTTWIPTDYNTTDSTVLGNIEFGKWDYRNLGLTYGTAIGKVWMGDAFRYIAYIATNAADYTNASAPTGYKGVELFAIDLVTGQKLWQWEHFYGRKNAAGNVIADNTIPGRVALGDVDADGSVERIYVGDIEGHLWELGASDGRNLNYLADTGTPAQYHSFPLYGTPAMTGTGATSATLALVRVAGTTALAQQPLTSPIGLGRFTDAPAAYATYLNGHLALVQGTMGVDWAISPYEPGNVLVLPVYPETGTRLSGSIDLTATRDPLLYGVLLPQAAWTIPLSTGERVFGMPRIVNNDVVFNTAFGSFNDSTLLDTTGDAGNLRIVGKDDASSQTIANTNKSFGGVLIFDGKVIVSTTTTIKQLATVPAALTSGGVAQRPFDRFTPAVFKTWEPQQASGSYPR